MTNADGASPFREFIPVPGNEKLKHLPTSDAHQWGELRSAEPFVSKWIDGWKELYSQPYKGITTDGNVLRNLYSLAEDGEDEGAPTAAMFDAAEQLLATTTVAERNALSFLVDAPQWRSWMNPEIYLFKNGVRLDEASRPLVKAIHALLRASLSPSGYLKCIGCMKTNAFLGALCNGRAVLNEESYNFVLFGEPSLKAPWGWQLYGHHLVVNVLIVGSQQVISPVFMGAEPNFIDVGPDNDVLLFDQQEKLGLAVMQSLESGFQKRAQVYSKLHDPAMPAWRFHPADQRHLGGAFQDNIVIPYEGVLVTEMDQSQQAEVTKIISLFIDYLPEKALAVRMGQVLDHWPETYFSWIGGFSDTDAFYYKIHSPVILVEFDHHSGVFLTNKEPKKFHIHTICRTPNGNDYGKQLVLKWREKHPQGQAEDIALSNGHLYR